jgi:Large extracellular alpha-helical protein
MNALRGMAAVLACAGLIAAAPALVQADDDVPASGYTPMAGESFFLLADSSFASDEVAKVRLEAPGRDYRRYRMEPYGGADIRVYRIDQPLDFLKRQKNLHRVLSEGQFKGEGLSNTLAYLWDNWYRKSRRVMQRTFSYESRQQVTEVVPELKMGNAMRAPTPYDAQPQYAPIPWPADRSASSATRCGTPSRSSRRRKSPSRALPASSSTSPRATSTCRWASSSPASIWSKRWSANTVRLPWCSSPTASR